MHTAYFSHFSSTPSFTNPCKDIVYSRLSWKSSLVWFKIGWSRYVVKVVRQQCGLPFSILTFGNRCSHIWRTHFTYQHLISEFRFIAGSLAVLAPQQSASTKGAFQFFCCAKVLPICILLGCSVASERLNLGQWIWQGRIMSRVYNTITLYIYIYMYMLTYLYRSKNTQYMYIHT